jgi:hypothetical protein
MCCKFILKLLQNVVVAVVVVVAKCCQEFVSETRVTVTQTICANAELALKGPIRQSSPTKLDLIHHFF